MHADEVVLPVSDEVVTLRAFEPHDRIALVEGRDREWERWLGPGSPEPSPTACIMVDGAVVGWIDADPDAAWLEPGEVNVGYSVFPEHRGNGYASRAVRLLTRSLRATSARRALLVIHEHNTASRRVAAAAGARVLADRRIPSFPSSVVSCIELPHDAAPTTP
jgi:RimJ/RimL family protein N-acetyltransferase